MSYLYFPITLFLFSSLYPFEQTLWGGRWQPGACATTGEEVEQINSHFSKLGSTTKHMLPEGQFQN